MIKANGYIIYKGASLLDGKPVIAVAQIGKSHNKKTGAMIQTQIIRSDIDPIEASKTGEDFSICGNCPHRGIAHNDPKKKTAKNRSCYVTLMHAPLTTYKQFKKGAVLLNFSRNALVDEPAMVEALDSGQIHKYVRIFKKAQEV